MAQAIRTKDTRVIDTGTLAVKVARPLPEGTHLPYSIYGTFRDSQRSHWIRQDQPQQAVLVHYTVTCDQGMLRDLEARAARNKSGEAVRGPASALAGRTATVNLSGIAALVRAAANTAGKRATDGPLIAKVKLLGSLEPFTPVCAHCGQPLEAHAHETLDVSDFWPRKRAWCVPNAATCQVCAGLNQHAFECPNWSEAT